MRYGYCETVFISKFSGLKVVILGLLRENPFEGYLWRGPGKRDVAYNRDAEDRRQIILCKQILFKVHSLWGELWMFFMVWWKVSSGCTSVKVIVKGPLQQALAHILDRKCAMRDALWRWFLKDPVWVFKKRILISALITLLYCELV